MRLRSVLTALTLCAFPAGPVVPLLAQGAGVGRTVDEGSFVVTRRGAPTQTESFTIKRTDNELIQATAQASGGEERINSTLTTDTLGSPVAYGFVQKVRGATTLEISALARGRRLSVRSADSRSNESMKDFPITPGQAVILDDALFVHQLYFVTLAKRTGEFEVIDPRNGRRDVFVLTGRGLEPLTIGGRSVTATHYSLVNGVNRREFWVDAAGRVLKAEIPAANLVAIRDEVPK